MALIFFFLVLYVRGCVGAMLNYCMYLTTPHPCLCSTLEIFNAEIVKVHQIRREGVLLAVLFQSSLKE